MQPKILINKHVYDGTTHTFGGDSSMLNTNKPIEHQGLNPVVNEHQMSAEYVPFEPTAIYNTPSIWQLKTCTLPVFTGNKRQY